MKKFLHNSKNLAYFSLLLIMFYLLFFTGFSLFFKADSEELAQSLDIVIRTTLGSVFGYLLTTLVTSNKGKYSKIMVKIKKDYKPKEETMLFNNIIIIIVSIVCLYSLSILLFARNFSDYFVLNNSSISTITQYRDFIATTIGALIAMTKK